MIDITSYRLKIGTFSQKIRRQKFTSRFDNNYQAKNGKKVLLMLQVILKFILLLSFLTGHNLDSGNFGNKPQGGF